MEDQPPLTKCTSEEDQGAMDMDAETEREVVVSEYYEVDDLAELLADL